LEFLWVHIDVEGEETYSFPLYKDQKYLDTLVPKWTSFYREVMEEELIAPRYPGGEDLIDLDPTRSVPQPRNKAKETEAKPEKKAEEKPVASKGLPFQCGSYGPPPPNLVLDEPQPKRMCCPTTPLNTTQSDGSSDVSTDVEPVKCIVNARKRKYRTKSTK
jgi:hypothetical protein